MDTGASMTVRARIFSAFAVTLAVAMANGSPAALAQSIGSASAVQNQVQGVRGGATRALAAGGSVYSDDSVKTGNASLAQLLFIDQTTFTVSANSEAVLKQVYHPAQGVKQLVMKAVTGAMRYVSGVQTPTKNNNQVQFPYGYITVRGTIFDIIIWPTRDLIVLDEGAITVHVYNGGPVVYMDKPGTYLAVHEDRRIDGPLTWDPAIIKLPGQVPFPLYGDTLWPGQPGLTQFDTEKDLNDMINPRSGSSGNGNTITGPTCAPGFYLSAGTCISNVGG